MRPLQLPHLAWLVPLALMWSCTGELESNSSSRAQNSSTSTNQTTKASSKTVGTNRGETATPTSGTSSSSTSTSSGGSTSTPDMGGSPDQGGTVEPEPQMLANPNTLDHDKLFECKDPTAPRATEYSVRRLTPGQYDRRWRQGGHYNSVYVRDRRYRYSTDVRDTKLDELSFDVMMQRALNLGADALKNRFLWQRCMRPEFFRDEEGLEAPTTKCLNEWAPTYLTAAWQRPPTQDEVTELVAWFEVQQKKFGAERAIELAAAKPYVQVAFLYREQLNELEKEDAQGRARLGQWAIAQAISSAITDNPIAYQFHNRITTYVDTFLRDDLDALAEAAGKGELETPEQVARHARALLYAKTDPSRYGEPQIARAVARFFQEYFGYLRVPYIFKKGGLPETGKAVVHYYLPQGFPAMADAMIAQIITNDTNVFSELLTSKDFYIIDIKQFPETQHRPFNFETRQDGWREMPRRSGILTHPAWLATHSSNQHTQPHPVYRGIWLREHLFCGTIPELPIDVDAKLPEDDNMTVRQRLDLATDVKEDPKNGFCWGCHQLMNPLGAPFERYTHYGSWREKELSANRTLLEIDEASQFVSTGDPQLEGKPIKDVPDMMRQLAQSERVEQCMIRHSFRFFTGRDERYEDACTLQQMHTSYKMSNGSFKEMLITLLSSDTFLYRQIPQEKP